MSTGFARHPFRILAAADLEVAKPGLGKSKGTVTSCNSTYARNLSVQPVSLDLSVADPEDFRHDVDLARGALGVLIACPPCTGFSQKKATNHMSDDPRNHLVERVAEFVKALLPEFLVMENVKELLQGNQKHHFMTLARALEALGYSLSATVHDLAEFGLPQRRKRALIIARRGGQVPPLRSPGLEWKTVRTAIGHLPPIEAGEVDPHDPMHVSPRMTETVLSRIRAIPRDGGSWGDVYRDPNLSHADKERLLIPRMFRARPGSFPDIYGRLWWDKPAPTVTRECAHVGNGRYAHPEQDRLLTVREMSLLQGFPPDYVFEGPLTAKYNQIGDAVPPMVADFVAAHILRIKNDEFEAEELLAGAFQPSFL